MRPCGLLLAAHPLDAEAVSRALGEQGGPEWDETVFRALRGLDLPGLVRGAPKAGGGSAVSIASSGWWLRALDALADRISALVGQPVLACFECADSGVSGWHLARPGSAPERAIHGESPRGWADGVRRLLELTGTGHGSPALDPSRVSPLTGAAMVVHGDDPAVAQRPGVFLFRLDDGGEGPVHRAVERNLLIRVRGDALVAGAQWRPAPARDPDEPPPAHMRAILLQSAVRLPGPPRWARALRPEAIAAARQATEADGWVCLVPHAGDIPAEYGAAVRVLQLAPLPDGSWLGVLHPRAGVRIRSLARGEAEVEAVPQRPPGPEAERAAALLGLLAKLKAANRPIRWSEAELRKSPDPAALIGWQVEVAEELCQAYLAAGDPITRIRVIERAL